MKQSKGFTLIETLIYTAVLGFLFAGVIISLLTMMRTLRNIRLSRSINTAGQIVVERIVREIRLADDIDLGVSIFGSSPGRLKLNTIDSSAGLPTTIDFSVNATALMVQEGVSLAQNLTASNIEVTNLVFNQISASTISKAIKVEIAIKGTKGDLEKTETFYSTAVLRRSY